MYLYSKRVKQFLGRPDVKQNIAKALLKRLWWRIRWSFTDAAYIIPFAKNLKIGIPRTGSASLIYYQGYSEFETADFFQRFLRPGMVMIDIGAHIGEYTLLAANLVGVKGEIHGFEPQTNLFPILSENVQMNNLQNVTLHRAAVSDNVGEIEFEVFDEPSISSIRKLTTPDKNAELVRVACTSLDNYWSDKQRKIDLIKVDVEGAEKLVFQGAKKLLNLESTEAPVWFFEYAPKAYAAFGYEVSELLEFLKNCGYQVWFYHEDGKIADFDAKIAPSRIINLIAAKDKNYLLSLLQGENMNLVPQRAQ